MPKKPIVQVESHLDEARQAWVYQVQGKLIGSPLCYEFLDEARERVESGTPNVVLDMSGVKMLNSTGIGIVAALYNTTKEKSGKVYLVGTTEATRRPLAATHVWELVDKCETLAELPDSF